MAAHPLPEMSLQVLGMGAFVMRNGRRTLGGPSPPASQLGVRYSDVMGTRDFGGNLVFRSHGIRHVAWASVNLGRAHPAGSEAAHSPCHSQGWAHGLD